MACAENKGLNAAKSRLDNFMYKKQPFSTLPAGGTAAFIFTCSLCLYGDKSVFVSYASLTVLLIWVILADVIRDAALSARASGNLLGRWAPPLWRLLFRHSTSGFTLPELE